LATLAKLRRWIREKSRGPTTYVDTVNLFLFSIFTLVRQRSGLATEDESVRKETKEDRFRKVHDSFAVNAETLPSEVQGETGEQRGLYVRLYGGLRDLGDDASHGELNSRSRAVARERGPRNLPIIA
jgi:hypothetical protein